MDSINKLIKTCILILLLALPVRLYSQTELPDISLKGTDGKEYKLSDLNDGTKVSVIIFWATWCKPCIDELDNIADYYEEWMEDLDFNLIAISIDDTRTSSAVKSFVRGREWPFRVLMDENQDAKRAMNVTDIPYYCIFDKNGKIVKRHTGYLPGDEELMFEEILRIDDEN